MPDARGHSTLAAAARLLKPEAGGG